MHVVTSHKYEIKVHQIAMSDWRLQHFKSKPRLLQKSYLQFVRKYTPAILIIQKERVMISLPHG